MTRASTFGRGYRRMVELLERDTHLDCLRAACAEAARGRGGVVLVEGEAGNGKTTLVARFVELLEPDARVLWGNCDDLSIPRPFSPLADVADSLSSDLADELRGTPRPEVVRRLVLAQLYAPGPTVFVLEDVHWADAATLDLVTVVGRRVTELPALLVLTYRPGELSPDHLLWRTLAAVRGSSRHLTVEPLSLRAVRHLAGGDGDHVFALTGGNPLFVTELVAHPTEGKALPASISTAVLGRTSRLSEASRSLLELVSMVPSHVSCGLVDRLVPGWSMAAAEPERRGLLTISPSDVTFRHELVRTAVASSVPVSRRRELHARILAALVELGAHAADIVQQAEGAGDLAAIATYAPVAGRQAAAVGAHREAHAHFRRAVDFATRWDVPEQALLHEELAGSAYAADRLAEAFPAIERALDLYRQLGDQRSVARCLRRRSRFHWYAGDGARAREDADAAVRTAQDVDDPAELARACSTVAQLAMLAQDLPTARRWGQQAVSLAEQSGDGTTRAHALVTLGIADVIEDPDDWVPLMAAHETADRLGERHEAARALVGLVDAHFCQVRPDLAETVNQRGLAYCRDHQVDTLLAFMSAMEAWLMARRGDWTGAAAAAGAEATRGSTVTQLLAEVVLAELALRSGDPDAAARLQRVSELAERSGEIQWVCPVVELEVEHALLHDLPMPRERIEHARRVAGAGWAEGWAGPRLAAWAAVAGVVVPAVSRQSDPHEAMTRRDWGAAAAAFEAAGWAYDQALMLSLLDDEAALTQALGIARRLRADPLARRVQRRMRALGLRLRRGPQRATRANVAGLTARELEVLELLAGGFSNAGIAERLTVSPRTAERHVSAVLGKLRVRSRADAVRRAIDLGLCADAPGQAVAGPPNPTTAEPPRLHDLRQQSSVGLACEH